MNDIIYLLQFETTTDENGFEVSTETQTEVFAERKSIRSQEFYEAQKQGYKLSTMFVIKPYEYDEQEYLLYEGKKYKVERTYEKDTENLEIICSRVI